MDGFRAEVLLAVIGILASLVSIAWTLWQWKKRLDDELIKRDEDRRTLHRIEKELHPNGGSSAVDRLQSSINRNANRISDLSEDIATMNKNNEDAHTHLTKRIDSLWQTFVGHTSPTPQTMAERHRNGREET